MTGVRIGSAARADLEGEERARDEAHRLVDRDLARGRIIDVVRAEEVDLRLQVIRRGRRTLSDDESCADPDALTAYS